MAEETLIEVVATAEEVVVIISEDPHPGEIMVDMTISIEMIEVAIEMVEAEIIEETTETIETIESVEEIENTIEEDD